MVSKLMGWGVYEYLVVLRNSAKGGGMAWGMIASLFVVVDNGIMRDICWSIPIVVQGVNLYYVLFYCRRSKIKCEYGTACDLKALILMV